MSHLKAGDPGKLVTGLKSEGVRTKEADGISLSLRPKAHVPTKGLAEVSPGVQRPASLWSKAGDEFGSTLGGGVCVGHGNIILTSVFILFRHVAFWIVPTQTEAALPYPESHANGLCKHLNRYI